MSVGDNESTATKHAGESMAISIAMAMQRYDARRIARWSTSRLHSKPLDAAIGRVPAPYRPGGRHGRRFRKNTQNTNKTQLLASNYGTFRALVVCENFVTQKGPSTHVIDATSVV